MLGDQQASSYEDDNIVMIKTSPMHLTNALIFYFKYLLYILLDYALSLYELYEAI
jgi:hypothetical protein